MADLSSLPRTSIRDHADDVLVPAWRLEAKRQERAKRVKLATGTIVAQASETEAVSP
jgi:hypothetical protein